MKNILWIILGLLISSQTSWAQDPSPITYRCWQFSTGGLGGRCTSPAIVFNPDGSYSMGSESGTYGAGDEGVTLSGSMFRGVGKFQEERKQIVFDYQYKGRQHHVVYLHSGGASQQTAQKKDAPAQSANDQGISQLDLIITCRSSGSAVSWINTVSLDCGDGNRYDALAVQKDNVTLSAYFRQVPPGKTCSVSCSSGVDAKVVGTVQTTGSVQQTLSGKCAW